MLTPADVLNERYRLDAQIAIGGMGEVWRATDLNLGRTVALKIMRPLPGEGYGARFRAEARTLAALHHPNVVNIYDYGQSPLGDGSTVSYLVMTYVDGQSLRERLEEAGRLPAAETMGLLAQAADALHAAHRLGVVHRDVKPANLLVQPDGTLILVDFGVARSTTVTSATTASGIIGTALYMAPEQASGRAVSAATDIYALGAVAYHCLAGVPPFTGQTPLEIALHQVTDEPPPLPQDVPPAARALVECALAKEPADRLASAAVFASAARAAAADPQTVPAGVSLPSRPRPGRPEPTAGGTAPLRNATGAGQSATAELAGPAPAPRRRRARMLTGTGAAAVVLIAAAAVTMLRGLGDGGPDGRVPPSGPAGSSPASTAPVATTVPAPRSTSRRPAAVEWSTSPSSGAPAPTGSLAPGSPSTARSTPAGAPTSETDSEQPPTAPPSVDPPSPSAQGASPTGVAGPQ